MIFQYFFVGVLGTIVGSFLNVLILRLPKEKTLGGRSYCPHCAHTLRSLDLVPVLSFLLLRGRCRYCNAPISWRYPAIELSTAALWLASFALYCPHNAFEWLLFVRLVFVISVSIVVFVIDFEHLLILDRILLPAAAVVLLCNVALDALGGSLFSIHSHTVSGIVAALVAGACFYALWFVSQGKWMGFGDVKLVAVLGLVLGWPQIFVSVLLAFWLGTLVAIPLLLAGRKALTSRVPFGTFLVVAQILTLWWGQRLLLWYVGLLRMG